MRWEDERYVRVYTRDTLDWLALSFDAQSLLTLVLRKVDRAGLLPLGRHGKRGVAVAIGHAGLWERLSPALEELLADGCLEIRGDTLIARNFIEAQEAPQSDAQRQRESRARARDLAAAGSLVTKRDDASVSPSRNVTNPQGIGHVESHAVTPSVPIQPSEPASQPLPASALPAAPPAAEAGEGIGSGLAGTVDPLRPTDTLAELRRRLADELAIQGLNPLRLHSADLAGTFRGALAAYGLDYVVTACADHARESGTRVRSLDWFVDFVAELKPPPRAPGECPKPEDPDFNDVEAWPTWGQWNDRDSGRSARSA